MAAEGTGYRKRPYPDSGAAAGSSSKSRKTALSTSNDDRHANGPVSQANLIKIVHDIVRDLVGMPTPDFQGNLSPGRWPDPDPESKDGTIIDPETNQIVWRPNWGKLNSIPTMNFVVNAVLACHKHPLFRDSITDSVLQEKVKKYIQSIHKGRKKTPTRKEAKNDRRALRERQRRLQEYITKKFDLTPLGRCRERALLRQAFQPRGIISTLRIVHYSQVLQHRLRVTQSVNPDTLASLQDAGALDPSMGDALSSSAPFDEFQIYTDAWWGEISAPFYLAQDVWWWSELMRWAVWTVYECYRASPVSSDRPSPIHIPIEKIDPAYGFHVLTPNSTSQQVNGSSPASSWPSIWACPAMVDYPTVSTLNPSGVPPSDTLYPDPTPDPTDSDLPTLLEVLQQPDNAELYAAISKHFRHPRLLSDEQLRDLWILREDQGKKREYEFTLQSLTGEGKMRSMEGVSPLLRSLEEGLEGGFAGGLAPPTPDTGIVQDQGDNGETREGDVDDQTVHVAIAQAAAAAVCALAAPASSVPTLLSAETPSGAVPMIDPAFQVPAVDLPMSAPTLQEAMSGHLATPSDFGDR